MKAKETSTEELQKKLTALRKEYDQYKAMGLSLNIARGFPSVEQLDMNSEIFHLVDEKNCFAEDGTDCRQYGVKYGLPELIRLFSELLNIPEENIIIGGESSLNFMYDQIMRLYAFGVLGNEPWAEQKIKHKLKWLCPVPGYDCHFNLTEALGFEMINIPMTENGPDMDMIENLVRDDPYIKGIWCVPQYSNPTGDVYSDETVDRLAHLKTAASDFVIIWDNAYCVHHIFKEHIVKDILKEAAKEGLENRILYFASTAKITFPGSGVSMMASGNEMIEWTRQKMVLQLFSHDKINQLRHVRYLKSADNIRAHMKEVAKILRPKFELVDRILKEKRAYDEMYTWVRPDGGYFITVDSYPGCAAKLLKMTDDAGVNIWTAGSTYPYHHDPNDSNIRLAPTFPSLETLTTAISLFCVCANICGIEKILEERNQ